MTFAKHLPVLLLCILCSCGSSKKTAQPATGHVSKKELKKVMVRAESQLGVPYKWGGKTPSGFDCSGFTGYCYSPYIKLPATAALQSKTGHKVAKRKARKGDLVFFRGSNAKDKSVGHVGIVYSGRGRHARFIHSATNGVQFSRLDEDYYKERLLRVRRVR